ncbi:MAG: GNAT family N-acetyltransferase [Candidatus Velthaea sp.]
MHLSTGIPLGYHDVGPGRLAAVVTYLEMHARAQLRPDSDPAPWTIERTRTPDLTRYRNLYRSIGMEYLWGSRLRLDDSALHAIVNDPNVAVYVLRDGERDAGIAELDFRLARACELVYFGVEGALIGRGAGGWLMNRVIERAWAAPIDRFWLHTCTLDHPRAAAFYRRAGFTAYKRQIEILDDPRVVGDLPQTAAPDIPIL